MKKFLHENKFAWRKFLWGKFCMKKNLKIVECVKFIPLFYTNQALRQMLRQRRNRSSGKAWAFN